MSDWRRRHPFMYGLTQTFGIFGVAERIEPNHGGRLAAIEAAIAAQEAAHLARCRCPECPPTCDCPMDPYHRWNCALTPIWAQTIRDQGCNPWTVITGSREWNQLIKDYVFNRRKGSQ